MGLETIEILLDCEEEFDVKIPDSMLEGMTFSVGQLYLTILQIIQNQTNKQMKDIDINDIWIRLATIIAGCYFLKWRDIAPSDTWEELRSRAHGELQKKKEN